MRAILRGDSNCCFPIGELRRYHSDGDSAEPVIKPLAPIQRFGHSCVMSDHQLKFKGPGFDFDAKGWLAILAAIAIVALILTLPQLLHWLF